MIRKLEAELAKKPAAVDETALQEVKQRIVVLERDLQNAHRAKDAAVQALESFAAKCTAKVEELHAIRFEDAKLTLGKVPVASSVRVEMPSATTRLATAASWTRPEKIATAANGDGPRLTGASLKIAGIAAGYAKRGEGISKKLLATLCGMKVDGGGFGARLSEARTANAIRT